MTSKYTRDQLVKEAMQASIKEADDLLITEHLDRLSKELAEKKKVLDTK
jgi:hypothetical protein